MVLNYGNVSFEVHGTFIPTNKTAKNWANGLANTVVLCISSFLSVIGCLVIILTYKHYKEIRTASRHIIVCIAVADLINALSNVSGMLIVPTASGKDIPCVTQSFIGSTSILCSFLWTVALALFLYLTIVVENQHLAKKLICPWFHLICWLLPLSINMLALHLGKLGNSTDADTAGWCWICLVESKYRSDAILWMFIDGKAIELLTYITVLILYTTTKYHLRKKIRNFSKDSSSLLTQTTITAARNTDRKLMMIPLCLIVLRLWGTIRFFLYIFDDDDYGKKEINTIETTLMFLQSAGDTLQGAVNCVLFCFLTPKVFNLVKQSVIRCCCTTRKRYEVLYDRSTYDDGPISDESTPYTSSK